jgi:hypothetical protein
MCTEVYFSTLKMMAAGSSETLTHIYQTFFSLLSHKLCIAFKATNITKENSRAFTSYITIQYLNFY